MADDAFKQLQQRRKALRAAASASQTPRSQPHFSASANHNLNVNATANADRMNTTGSLFRRQMTAPRTLIDEAAAHDSMASGAAGVKGNRLAKYGADWRKHAAKVVLGIDGSHGDASAGERLEEGAAAKSGNKRKRAPLAVFDAEDISPQAMGGLLDDTTMINIDAATSVSTRVPLHEDNKDSVKRLRGADDDRPVRFVKTVADHGDERDEELNEEGAFPCRLLHCWRLALRKNGKVVDDFYLDPSAETKVKRLDRTETSTVWRVGRSITANDIRLAHSSISRLHAELELLESDALSLVCIKDLGSRRGTYVNDMRVCADRGAGNRAPTELLLRHGDVVRFGQSKREFTVRRPRSEQDRHRQSMQAEREVRAPFAHS